MAKTKKDAKRIHIDRYSCSRVALADALGLFQARKRDEFEQILDDSLERIARGSSCVLVVLLRTIVDVFGRRISPTISNQDWDPIVVDGIRPGVFLP